MRRLIIAIAVLLFISGCTDLQGYMPTSFPGLSSQPKEGSYLGPGGSVTMEMSYPKEKGQVLKDISFSPLIQVKNTGSSEARGQVCVAGLDPTVFGGATSCDCQTYSFIRIPGEGYQPESMAFGPYSLSFDAPDAEYTITAVNKFAYSSKAAFNPCIRKESDTMDCRVSIAEASNGPVAIMSITEVASPAGSGNVVLAFNIEIRKVGSGNVIEQRSVETECSVEQFNPNSRKAKPKIYGTIAGLPLIGSVSCKEAMLNDDGTGMMSCIAGDVSLFDESGNYRFSGSSQTPSLLTIVYGFEEIDSNKFTIGGSRY